MLVKNHFYQFDSYFSNKFCNEAINYIDKTKLTFEKFKNKKFITYYKYKNKYPHAGAGVRVQF